METKPEHKEPAVIVQWTKLFILLFFYDHPVCLRHFCILVMLRNIMTYVLMNLKLLSCFDLLWKDYWTEKTCLFFVMKPRVTWASFSQ